MTIGDEEPGSRVFAVTFVATAPLAIWLVVAFTLGSAIEGRLPRGLDTSSHLVHGATLCCAYLATWWLVRAAQGRNPRFLRTPPRYSVYDALLPMALWGIATYLIVGVILGLAAFVLVNRQDEHSFLVVYAFAACVPVWFALPIAALIASRREWQ